MGICWLMSLARMLGWTLRLIDLVAHWCYQGPSFFIVTVGSTSFSWLSNDFSSRWGWHFLKHVHRGRVAFQPVTERPQSFVIGLSWISSLPKERHVPLGEWGLGDWQVVESLKAALAALMSRFTLLKNTQGEAVLFLGKVQSRYWVIVTELPVVSKRNQVLICIIL